MEYNFSEIEKKWRENWKKNNTYIVENKFDKPKCYVLDMFPYPSGAGLHVGHPLGYIASDIYARYKRLKGFNVLHPMGFDAFGLPAEQYAIETGQHPADTTEKNIKRYKEQLDNIGFCYDWSREVKTSDPKYYKWTQWIFLELFNSWYNKESNKTEKISTLILKFQDSNPKFQIDGIEKSWNELNHTEQQNILMQYRLAYRAESYVNWCEALGTVLANDEVVNGVSERGGHPVEKKLMSQWFLRITDFADRLLSSLDQLEYPESLKEMQRNWIGKSVGAEISFKLTDESCQLSEKNSTDNHQPTTHIPVFTTRPDTIFGVSFMVIAPEHSLLKEIVSVAQQEEVNAYLKYVASRSDRERQAEKKITGCFTGAYCIHPFTNEKIPVWTSEYVLAGYGTGAIMAVPCGDERDYAFAKHFNLPIPNIFKDIDISENAFTEKGDVVIDNSDFISGLKIKDAAKKIIEAVVEKNIGSAKVNFKMRDAGFSRQRYWGEPFPIVYNENGTATALPQDALPLELPHLEKYSAGPNGKGPLANATDWVNTPNGQRETDTMPGYAGSSWYYLRYMDPHNENTFADKKITDYWNQVDVYIGGAEHAVGHLLYSRMWCKALHDLGHIGFDEPYKKMINQGMIGGSSRYFYKILLLNVVLNFRSEDYPIVVSKNIIDSLLNDSNKIKLIDFIKNRINTIPGKNVSEYTMDESVDFLLYKLHVDVSLVNGELLDIDKFRKWKNGEYQDAIIITEEENKFICISETEKMSKSKYNVVNPDDIITQYGADTFRMYEMFLGPIELSKPWDTKGIEGTHRFLRKLWRLFFDESGNINISNEAANDKELKVLHKHIKKIQHDIENFAMNTCVSQFMITTNELQDLKCNKKEILEPLLVTLAPFAPFIAEELYSKLGNTNSVLDAAFPNFEEKYLIENEFNYPVAVMGKTRTDILFPLDASQEAIQEAVLANEIVQKWMEGKPLKKMVFVKGKMINVVV